MAYTFCLYFQKHIRLDAVYFISLERLFIYLYDYVQFAQLIMWVAPK